MVAGLSDERSHATPRLIGVALYLDERDGWLADRAVVIEDTVVRVFPALVQQPVFRARAIGEVAGNVVGIRLIRIHPLERPVDVCSQLAKEAHVARPADIFGEQHQKPGGRVYGSVVGNHRHFTQVRPLADAQLVENLTRLLVLEVVVLRALVLRQQPERASGERRMIGERLEGGDAAIAAKERDVPRNASGQVEVAQTGRRQHLQIGQ